MTDLPHRPLNHRPTADSSWLRRRSGVLGGGTDLDQKSAARWPRCQRYRPRLVNDDVDVSLRRFETNLNFFGPEHQPPIPRAAARFRYAAKIEADDKTLRRYFRWIDLPAHTPDQHSRIKVIRTDQSLSPALARMLSNSTMGRKSSPAVVSR
jgi:hypothetical protein